MDGCVLLTSTPSCVVSPRGETTHSGVDVNNTHPSMINPLNIGSCCWERHSTVYGISRDMVIDADRSIATSFVVNQYFPERWHATTY